MTLELIIGPMFSGKTSELLRRVDRLQYTDKTYCIIKHSSDTRYSEDCVSTHSNINKNATFVVHTILSIEKELDKFDYIAIDEGQFFNDLLDFIKKYSNKNIIVAGLNADVKQNIFNNINNIIPYATKINLLSAICTRCKKDNAYLTTRIDNKQNYDIIDIGSTDKYASICRNCINTKNN